ncbi:MAG: hypothetical protein Kapaf2KO_03390 [Candidatus Kapaibacteriales bacterium]
MNFEVEISMYPLTEDYVPPIKGFIEDLKKIKGATVMTSDMSTRVTGNSIEVWEGLRKAMENVYSERRACFVMKVLKGFGS